MANEISINELRNLTNYFFDYLENTMGIKQIEIKEDYYWDVLSPAKYDIDTEPEKLGVGQLTEDLYFLKEILKDKDLAVVPNLTHLCAVLEYICYNAKWSEN